MCGGVPSAAKLMKFIGGKQCEPSKSSQQLGFVGSCCDFECWKGLVIHVCQTCFGLSAGFLGAGNL